MSEEEMGQDSRASTDGEVGTKNTLGDKLEREGLSFFRFLCHMLSEHGVDMVNIMDHETDADQGIPQGVEFSLVVADVVHAHKFDECSQDEIEKILFGIPMEEITGILCRVKGANWIVEHENYHSFPQGDAKPNKRNGLKQAWKPSDLGEFAVSVFENGTAEPVRTVAVVKSIDILISFESGITKMDFMKSTSVSIVLGLSSRHYNGHRVLYHRFFPESTHILTRDNLHV